MPTESVLPVHLTYIPTFPSPADSKGFAFAIPGTPYSQTTERRLFIKWPFGKVALWLFLLFVVAVVVVTVDSNDTNVILTGIFPKSELETSSVSKEVNNELSETHFETYDAARAKRSMESSQASQLLSRFAQLSNIVERALSNQQCYQRFVCEIGNMARMVPGFKDFLSYYSVAKFFVSPNIRRALDKVSREEDCSSYTCGLPK